MKASKTGSQLEVAAATAREEVNEETRTSLTLWTEGAADRGQCRPHGVGKFRFLSCSKGQGTIDRYRYVVFPREVKTVFIELDGACARGS